jgi:signal transduction histidine kinase/CheY-like chemotaxis protein
VKLSLPQKVLAAFGAAVLILLLVAVDSIHSLVRVNQTTAEVMRTYDTYAALERLIGHMRDVETGQRGYVITGDEDFLEPYHSGMDAVPDDWDDLRGTIGGDSLQLARTDTLMALVERRVAISRGFVEMRRHHGFEATAEAVGRGTGLRAMEEIRILVDRMLEHEEQKKARARLEQQRSVWRATSVGAGGFLLALAIGVTAMVGMRSDIRRRVAAERRALQAKEEAEAANRAKSEFLARMSHELRTPLNSVIGFSGILLKNRAGTLGARDLSYLDRIQMNGRHLLGLINDILDLSKIEAQRMEVELAEVELDRLIRETLSQMDDRTIGKPVVLRADLPAVVAPLRCDGAKVKQVLLNLVGNALKFTEQGAVKVLLFVESGSGRPLRLDVIDTGIGIPEHRLEAIFAAFEQADRSIAQRFGGTGLGLSISRALCTLMGYDLRVQSQVGGGTTFSVLLSPDAPMPERAVHHAANRSAALDPARELTHRPWSGAPVVLVIDDEADSRTLLVHLLEEAGYDVVAAACCDEGLRLARACEPDLITLDLLMTPQPGTVVLEEMRDDPSLAGVPVVVVSVVAADARPWENNEVARLAKPVMREALLEAVEGALRGRALRRGREGPARERLSAA